MKWSEQQVVEKAAALYAVEAGVVFADPAAIFGWEEAWRQGLNGPAAKWRARAIVAIEEDRQSGLPAELDELAEMYEMST